MGKEPFPATVFKKPPDLVIPPADHLTINVVLHVFMCSRVAITANNSSSRASHLRSSLLHDLGKYSTTCSSLEPFMLLIQVPPDKTLGGNTWDATFTRLTVTALAQ